MISLVCPCLNEEKHLPTFLSSLVHQTCKDFEVIIVDGGSSDRSLEIIDSYRDLLHIQVIVNHTRNLGYVRNVGSSYVKGDVMFHGNTDGYLEPTLLEKLTQIYRQHPDTISVTGRTYPLGTSIIAHLGYQIFDFLRFIFTCAPMPIKKYRPSGNFLSCRTETFRKVGGFPNVPVNEDGLLGQKFDCYAIRNHKAVMFRLDLFVGHHVKKFEKMGGIKALLFYFYTLGNLFPMLKGLLKPIEQEAGLVFQGKPIAKLDFKMVMRNFWEWL